MKSSKRHSGAMNLCLAVTEIKILIERVASSIVFRAIKVYPVDN